MVRLDRQTLIKNSDKEWLLTNGIGGFASLSCSGANNRRYHGILIAALSPPIGRKLLVSNILEEILFDGENNAVSLMSFKTSGNSGIYESKGHEHLTAFEQDIFPTYFYSVGSVLLNKKITLVYGHNAAVIRYTVKTFSQGVKLILKPLLNYRDFHGDSNRNDIHCEDKITINLSGKDTDSKSIPYHDTFFEKMYYEEEDKRGLHCTEDHFMPGEYTVKIDAYKNVVFDLEIRSSDEPANIFEEDVFASETDRINKLYMECTFKSDMAKQIAVYADAFFAYRKSTDSHTVIAGYPWFSDWGRDAMIAITGIGTAAGRYEYTEEILTTFAKYEKGGMLPNTFPDNGAEPLYNTADAPLWMFEAAYALFKSGHKLNRIITDAMTDIIEYYMKGTGTADEPIRENDYGLIECGTPLTNMTWMDAKVGNTAFTPRYGCAVEINALWYNALKIQAEITGNAVYERHAERTGTNFVKCFLNEDGYLSDTIVFGKGGAVVKVDNTVMPNQIIGIGLAFSPLSNEIASNIIRIAHERLYTPVGMRTLDSHDINYNGTYIGNVYMRDSAYHRGTAWMWLLGPFMLGGLACGYFSVDDIREMLIPVMDQMNCGCVNMFSEISDGDAPFLPKGAFAQAWSSGEILRILKEVEQK